MGPTSLLLLYYSRRLAGASSFGTSTFFFLPTSLAFLTSLLIVLYLFSTSTITAPSHLSRPDNIRNFQNPQLAPSDGLVSEGFGSSGSGGGIGLAGVSMSSKGHGFE